MVILPPFVAPHRAGTLRDYWKQRLVTHTNDIYRGVRLAKMPEDLRTYQHVIDGCRPEIILELGTFSGGGAIWFHDQLQTFCGGGIVVTVDTKKPEHHFGDGILFIEGDITDPDVRDIVFDICEGRRVMVSEDTRHDHETTLAALTLYSDLVPKDSWYVAEDGIVDEEDLVLPMWPMRGVQPAIADFLASERGPRFIQRDLSPYGLTTNVRGWLVAVA